MTERLKILEIWVDPVSWEDAARRVEGYLQGTRPHTIFASNPEKNFSVAADPVLRRAFQNADLLLPDGIGVVLAARLLYGATLSRIPGVEFMEEICRLAARKGKGVFVYGAAEAVSQAAVAKLKARHPGLSIAGRSHGYVKEEGMKGLIHRINDSRAEILFLALGSPRQEKWIARYGAQLRFVRVCQGIGGTLDTLAGNVKRAPEIWKKCSAEWLYRLIAEPRRIRRQKVLPLFAAAVFAARLRRPQGSALSMRTP